MTVTNADRSKSPRRRRRAVVRREIIPSTLATTRADMSGGPVVAGRNGISDRRAMLVDYLKLLAWWLGRPPAPELSPRLQQTLTALLRGRSEKQIAADLGVSLHTAHGYVKELHRRFNVTSRGELLVRFLPSSR